MRSNVALFWAAALPAMLAANTVSIGLSTDPVDFSPTTGTTGTVTVGKCVSDCELDGTDPEILPPFTWSLKSDGTLDYVYSGTPGLFNLTGNTTGFLLTDLQGDSIPGTITWNTATVQGTTPAVSRRFTHLTVPEGLTDVEGTLQLGAVEFASDTDPLAMEVLDAFGSLPVSGETGKLDLYVNCSPDACISTPADILTTNSRSLRRALKDPSGSIQVADVTFNSTAAPEPGTLFVLPALLLGGFILRKRFVKTAC